MRAKEKRCTKCKHVKPLEAFSRSSKNASGRRSWCKECERASRNWERIREWSRDYARRNAERVKEIKRQSRRRNVETTRAITERRRARLAGAAGSYTAKEWRFLCDAFDNRCLQCGEHRTVTADHVIPISRGGSNDISNLQPLCAVCNPSKGTSTADLRDPDILAAVLLILKHGAPMTALLPAYQCRLDKVVGPAGWQTEYTMTARGMVCRLTVLGVTRSACGDYPIDAGDENAATSAEAQAFKRACAAFGLGRYLYALPATWADYDQEKRQIVDPQSVVYRMYQALQLSEDA